MKTIIALTSCLIALPLTPLLGQTVAYTTPSGYVKTDLVVGFNPIGINLHGEILVSGTIDSEAGAVITDADVDFAAAMADANATYLFEVTSGPQNGSVSVISASTATTVTIEGTGVVAGTASYTIRQAKTLNEVFGTGTEATLQGSFNSTASDIVWLPDGTGDYERYYYNSNFNEFRSTGNQFNSPPKPISFFYPDGALIQVKSNSKTIILFGEVKTTGTVIGTPTGFTIVSVPSPTGQTLNELGLADDLTGSFNSVAADIVWAYNTTTKDYDRYYYNSNFSVWRSTESQFSGDEGATVVQGALVIQRKSTSTAALVELPSFFSTL